MKYDDASWHHGSDNFPPELPDSAGATHTGIFVAWALLSGLGSEIHTLELPEGLAALKSRTITPGAFFLKFCDGKFTDEDLNDQGNAFAAAYFDFESGNYLDDYDESLGSEADSLYHVPDTWQSYDTISQVIGRRFSEWQAGG